MKEDYYTSVHIEEFEIEARVQRLVAVAPPRIGDFEARRLLPPRAVTPLGTAQT